jgi:1-acyl-sn-glycerol-3-phosphate acyltransferase
MRNLVAALKMLGFVLICLPVPIQSLLLLVHKGRASFIIPHLWHIAVCAIFGIRPHVIGKPIKDRQVLYVGNHFSYLDISLIATQLCFASFVAKQEVASMFLYGYLSTLHQTVFIGRSRSSVAQGVNVFEGALANGRSLILFPEGTTTDSTHVLPFKSSLFALLLEERFKDLLIQPFTLEMTAIDGHAPRDKQDRLLYAWPPEETLELTAHLWRFAKTRGVDITITFHEPVSVAEYTDRKALAKTCHDAVSKGLTFTQAA